MNKEEVRASIKAERDSMRDPDEVIADEETITIYGVVYARHVFRTLGLGPIGSLLRLEKREDGVITIHVYSPGEQVAA